MKYCKVIGLNRSFNYNSDVLTIGTFYEIIGNHPTPNRFCIINNHGEKWWVGEEITTEDEDVGITWRNMVVFLNELPNLQVGVISV